LPRRSDTSFLHDLFEIAALLPWWVGVALAIVVYAALHHFAAIQVPNDVALGQVSQTLVRQAVRMIASIGQYVLPLPFLAGAIASVFRRRKRAGLFQGVASAKSGSALSGMNWRDFELLVGEAFRRRGFSVVETGGESADGGVDLKLSKGGEVFLVQCKQWRAYKVSVNVVRELFGVMAAQGATGGFVVTSGRFTEEARAFAEGRNIELLDGPALMAMIGDGRAVIVEAAPANTPTDGAEVPPIATTANEPACPVCGRSMVRRTARRGQKAGGEFWGCVAYPECRGTRPID